MLFGRGGKRAYTRLHSAARYAVPHQRVVVDNATRNELDTIDGVNLACAIAAGYSKRIFKALGQRHTLGGHLRLARLCFSDLSVSQHRYCGQQANNTDHSEDGEEDSNSVAINLFSVIRKHK